MCCSITGKAPACKVDMVLHFPQDLHMQHDDWQLSKFPFIPGHEVVGILRAYGSQVTGLEIGQRVGVGWIRSSCRRCPACLRGEENIW